MKLYTEEQVIKAIELSQECEYECGGVYFDYTETEILEILTPIKLPSDEEIQMEINCDVHIQSDTDFFNGAIWMRDKLTNTK